MKIAAERQRGPAAELRRTADLMAYRAGASVKSSADRSAGLTESVRLLLQRRGERLFGRSIYRAVIEGTEVGRHGPDVGIRQGEELSHNKRHRPGGYAMETGLAGAEICIYFAFAPGNWRLRQRCEGRGLPTIDEAAREVGVRLFGAESVSRRVAGAAMAKTFDQIRAAVPGLRLGRGPAQRRSMRETRRSI